MYNNIIYCLFSLALVYLCVRGILSEFRGPFPPFVPSPLSPTLPPPRIDKCFRVYRNPKSPNGRFSPCARHRVAEYFFGDRPSFFDSLKTKKKKTHSQYSDCVYSPIIHIRARVYNIMAIPYTGVVKKKKKKRTSPIRYCVRRLYHCVSPFFFSFFLRPILFIITVVVFSDRELVLYA